MTLSRLSRTARDALILAALGAGLAGAANHWSPRGLALRRDYFPAVPADGGVATADPAARFARRGLALVTHARAAELFRDPRFAAGLVVFVDARDDRHFQEGHIPGAVQWNHYRMEQHIATVLAVCQLAEQVVVYCTGGNCEDSELAAMDLVEFGVPAAKLVVYTGGLDEWRRHGLPIEAGPRGSGAPPTP